MQKSYFKHDEIRNYTICFIVALVVEVLAFIWVWLMIDNRVDTNGELNVKNNGINKKDKTDNKIKADVSREDRDIHPFRLLLDFENIKSMIRTLIKKRPNKVRTQILFIYLSITIFVITITCIKLLQVYAKNNQ